MPRKKKLEELTQTHGKVENFRPTSLDQIWGDTGLSKYGTMDEEEYSKKLNDMNKAELQAHATKTNIVPIDDRERLIKRLLHEFRLHVASFRYPTDKRVNSSQNMSPEVAKILSEGR